jgi:hypothetical protein
MYHTSHMIWHDIWLCTCAGVPVKIIKTRLRCLAQPILVKYLYTGSLRVSINIALNRVQRLETLDLHASHMLIASHCKFTCKGQNYNFCMLNALKNDLVVNILKNLTLLLWMYGNLFTWQVYRLSYTQLLCVVTIKWMCTFCLLHIYGAAIIGNHHIYMPIWTLINPRRNLRTKLKVAKRSILRECLNLIPDIIYVSMHMIVINHDSILQLRSFGLIATGNEIRIFSGSMHTAAIQRLHGTRAGGARITIISSWWSRMAKGNHLASRSC